jgi:MFS family permease
VKNSKSKRETAVKNETTTKDRTETELNTLYVRSVINSFGTGMVSPFTGAYAVKLGASTSDMGWFQSSSNISNNLMQIFWGRLSDNLQRRIPFIIFGSLIIAVLWLPMIFVTNATQLIILLAIQALLGSMATPAWTALIGDLTPSLRLGRTNAAISLWASIGSLIATMASGIIMMAIGASLEEMFFIPLMVAAICGIASSTIMLRIKEKKSTRLNLRQSITSDIFNMLTIARKTPDFIKYCYVEGVFQFFMSIAWPLLSITQIRVLNASMLEIALLTVVQALFTIIFQGWAGRLADRAGRKPLMVFYRFSLLTVPIAYAFAPNMNTLIAVGVFWGIVTALGQASMTAYLLDIAPQEYRGSFAATYNLVVGVTTFFGSLIGGYLSDYSIGIFGLVLGLQIVYMLSLIGRTIGAVLYLRLKETLKQEAS